MADWDDWRFALTLWRAGTTAAAAPQLGTDISTVLRRVRRLEKRLGLRVLERDGHCYVATETGRKLINAAERMEGEVVQVERFVRDGDDPPRGPAAGPAARSRRASGRSPRWAGRWRTCLT